MLSTTHLHPFPPVGLRVGFQGVKRRASILFGEREKGKRECVREIAWKERGRESEHESRLTCRVRAFKL